MKLANAQKYIMMVWDRVHKAPFMVHLINLFFVQLQFNYGGALLMFA